MEEGDGNGAHPTDVARFELLAIFGDARNAIGEFLADFAFFETAALNQALDAVSTDSMLVEHLPELMDVSQRLKLLRYLGEARRLPKVLKDDIRKVAIVGDKLRECRNDVAHGVLIGPTLRFNPNEPGKAELVPASYAGVQRPRSRRKLPDTDSITATQLLELYREWVHEVPTIRKWSEIARALQQATLALADKLRRYSRKEQWETVTIPDVEAPTREKATAAIKPRGASRKKTK